MKCSIDRCETKSRKRGWCEKHYENWRRSGADGRQCCIKECFNGVFGKGLCQKHYIRNKIHGSPDTRLTMYRVPAETRYHLGYDKRKDNECWPWIKGNIRGYGRLPIGRKTVFAHRFGWTLVNGPIPDGMYVCHKCDNPSCQNPKHWFIGTPKENTEDMVRKGRLKTNPNKDSKGRFTTA